AIDFRGSKPAGVEVDGDIIRRRPGRHPAEHHRRQHHTEHTPGTRHHFACHGLAPPFSFSAGCEKSTTALPIPGNLRRPKRIRKQVVLFDRTVKIWDVTTGRETVPLRGHTWGAVNAVAFLDGGRRLASTGADKTLRIWDTTTGRLVFTLRG